MQLLLRSAGELALIGVFLFAHLEVDIKGKTERGKAFPAKNLTGNPDPRKNHAVRSSSSVGAMPSRRKLGRSRKVQVSC